MQSINQSNNLSLDELKNSLFEDLKSRVEDKILEQANFDLLSKLIKNAENKEEAIAIAELGTTYKRTGFHFDKKLEKIGSTIKYFKKNNELSFCQNGKSKTHKLIIGDNYYALLNLSISYKGKIDVIYIDPPYGKDDMGEFADTNYNNAITRDNLLSMLYPRLVLAKQLLSDEGVIFCSIDDKNHAYVKCLFDEIFGERTFVFDCPRITKKGGKTTKTIQKNHDYILCYTKSESILFSQLDKEDAKYNLEDEYVKERGKYALTQTLDYNSLQYSENMDYEININGKIYVPGGDIQKYKDRHNGKHGKTDWVWRWSKKAVEWGLKEGLIVVKDTGRIYTKTYLNCKKVNGKNELIYVDATKPYSTRYFMENDFSNDNGKKDLDKVFTESNTLFKNPKPVSLIKELIKMVSLPVDSVVLDFFAGSGTTGQAVLELNKEDGGNRTFILCTNNEKTDMNPNGIAYDVTSKRLKRVMTGSCYDGTNDFGWIKKNSPLGDNLDVYEIADVSNSEQSEGKSAFDVIDEELYGEVKMTPKDKIKWVCENFSVTQKYLEDRI